MHAAILRHYPDAANQHLVLRAVIPFHAAVRSRREGVIFPAHSVRKRKVGSDVPAVADVESVVTLAGSESAIGSHEDFASVSWQTQQEGGVTVVLAAGGPTQDLRRAGAEAEASLSAIKRAGGLRLQLVHAGEVKLTAKAHLMASLGPVEVTYIRILRVMTIIRHEVIVDPDVGIVTYSECGPPSFKAARAVDPGDPNIDPELLIQAALLDARIHAR